MTLAANLYSVMEFVAFLENLSDGIYWVFSELEWNKINSLIKNVNSYYDTLRSAKFFRKIVPYIPKPVKRGILKVMSLRKGR